MAFFRTALCGIALSLIVVVPINTAHAVDLGMTPSHVFGLWANINAVITGLAKSTENSAAERQLKSLTSQTFSGKTPGDVLQQVGIFRNKLDAYGNRRNVPPTKVYRNASGNKITPSVVFLNSGHVLDSMARLMIRTDPNHLISGYYRQQQLSGKTPSDVFGIVELANRRLDIIMNNR